MLGVDRLLRIPVTVQPLAETKADLRETFFPHRDCAKARVIEVTSNRMELVPPTINDWLHVTEDELFKLKIYLLKVAHHVKELGPAEELKYLNAQASFEDHLLIMHHYMDVLCSLASFQAFLAQNGISQNFMHALVEIHDAGRFVFNGRLPLLYVDGVSDGILKANFPTFPKEYTHSIKWIINDKVAPDLENETEIEIQQIPIPSLVGLLLKAVDTMGKFHEGNLLELEANFSDGGRYQKWLKDQVDSKRLPFYVKGEKLVTPKQYAASDERLTRKGAQVIESLTGLPFSEIRNRVAAQLTK